MEEAMQVHTARCGGTLLRPGSTATRENAKLSAVMVHLKLLETRRRFRCSSHLKCRYGSGFFLPDAYVCLCQAEERAVSSPQLDFCCRH
ncbi:hypothetical protein MTO96_017205 [Rhipicephalus appendiculatus]